MTFGMLVIDKTRGLIIGFNRFTNVFAGNFYGVKFFISACHMLFYVLVKLIKTATSSAALFNPPIKRRLRHPRQQGDLRGAVFLRVIEL